MKVDLKLPDSLKLPDIIDFQFFLQAQLNRLAVGHLRYGSPNRRKNYVDRMILELDKYKETGNFENLINLANYAVLESVAPQNSKLHFDPTAASATREILGGHIA